MLWDNGYEATEGDQLFHSSDDHVLVKKCPHTLFSTDLMRTNNLKKAHFISNVFACNLNKTAQITVERG